MLWRPGSRYRGYLTALADVVKEHFGMVMCATVAQITTVVLDKKVTVQMVECTLHQRDG